jgi:hypothetical protein
MGVIYSLLCRRCETEEGSSAHVLYECDVLATLKHTHLSFFFLDPGDVRSQSLGKIWNFIKGTDLHDFHISLTGKKGLSKIPTYMWTERARTHLLFYSILVLAKYYTFRPKLRFSEESLTRKNVIRYSRVRSVKTQLIYCQITSEATCFDSQSHHPANLEPY